MALETISAILLRAIGDPRYRETLFADFDRALPGCDLTAGLILASLLTHILEGMLRGGLGEALKPDGVLIASGLPKHHAPLIQKAAATAGLRILEHRSLEGWSAVVAQRQKRRWFRLI